MGSWSQVSAMETSHSERLERLFQAWQKKKEATFGTPPPSPGGQSRASISRSFDKMVLFSHLDEVERCEIFDAMFPAFARTGQRHCQGTSQMCQARQSKI